MLEIQDLDVCYGARDPGVSSTVGDGEMVPLVDANGAGRRAQNELVLFQN